VRYSDSPELDAVYRLLARLSRPADPGDARLDQVMVIADALAGLGEDRSWASVWWAYGALHYELSDEALERAAVLLTAVERPEGARAAALMLRAEVENSQAVYAQAAELPYADQRRLLAEAVALEPEWPALRMRLAHACVGVGALDEARVHARQALALLERPPTGDPFDSALTGRNTDRAHARQELQKLGLTDAPTTP
jgi:hypothetical protein